MVIGEEEIECIVAILVCMIMCHDQVVMITAIVMIIVEIHQMMLNINMSKVVISTSM